MKSKHIRIIIILASLALIGVLINQVFWIRKEISIQKNKIEVQKNSLHLKKEHFENIVTLALVNVRDELLSLNKELSGLYLEPVKQITPNYFVVSFYDTINPNLLAGFRRPRVADPQRGRLAARVGAQGQPGRGG